MARQRRHARKRELALQLRRLRDRRGVSQGQLAGAAGLTVASGPLPAFGALERYVAACGGRLTLKISGEAGKRASGEGGPA